MKITRRQIYRLIESELHAGWESMDVEAKVQALHDILEPHVNFLTRNTDELAESSLSRDQIRKIIFEAFDTKLARARSKGNLPDARPDEKRAARRAERRFGKRESLIDFEDVQGSFEGLGPGDDHLESITPQDMADAKRYAQSDLARDQADYLGISVEDFYRIRQEMDDWYEERHMLDQMDWQDEVSREAEIEGELDTELGDDFGQELGGGMTSSEYMATLRRQWEEETGDRHPLDVDGDGKLTIS